MTTLNLNNDNIDITNPATMEELIDEIKCISFTISAIGDSVATMGLPSDSEIFNQTMARLSWKLDAVAEMLETVSADLKEGEQDE